MRRGIFYSVPSLRIRRRARFMADLVFMWMFLPTIVLYGQSIAPFATGETTITVQDPRGLLIALERVEKAFLKPVTFEEVPYESRAELRTVAIVNHGMTKQLLANPDVNFTVTLSGMDTTHYWAAQSVLNAFVAAGGRGEYAVLQSASDRVDVVPKRVLAANGSMRDITSIMSHSIKFDTKRRSLADTVQLIADQLSAATGYKVAVLGVPGHFFEPIELGANGESGADVVQKVGNALNRITSFSLLYEPNQKQYYLNVKSISPDEVPGGPPVHGKMKSLKVGPANNPFFKKN